MKKFIVLSVVVLLSSPVFLFADPYALVIGNGAYRSIGKLEKPIHDAEDVAQAIKKFGYKVDLKTDVTFAEMDSAIDTFVENLAVHSENEGFFWFGGQGVQINGDNYVLPVDALADSESSLRRSSYRLDDVVRAMTGANNKVNVVVFDAGSASPFPATRGLGSIGVHEYTDPQDIFILASAGPGQIVFDGDPGERNSPFTKAFLNNIGKDEPLQMVVLDIVRQTLEYTGGSQEPYYKSHLFADKYYSLYRDMRATLEQKIINIANMTEEDIRNASPWDMLQNLNSIKQYLEEEGSLE